MTDRRDFLKRLASIPLLAPLLPSIAEPILPDQVVAEQDVTLDCLVCPDPRCAIGEIDGIRAYIEEMTWSQDDYFESMARYAVSPILRGYTRFSFSGYMECSYVQTQNRFLLPVKRSYIFEHNDVTYFGMCYITSIEAHPTDSLIKFEAESLLEQTS